MKNFSLYIFLLAPALVFAQGKPTAKPAAAKPAMGASLDRSKKPGAGPAPSIQLAKATKFTLANGLQCFVVTDRKLPRVAFNLVLDYDPIQEGDAAGYVDMAGDLIGAGTKSRPKEKLDDEVDFMGASLSTSASGVFMSGLSRYTAQMLDIMADVVINPALEESEFAKIQKRTISGIVAQKTDPSAISRQVSAKLLFGSHPYGTITDEATAGKATVAKCREFYNSYFRPNVGYLAIVGDVDAAAIKPQIEKAFAGWQRGEVPKANYPLPERTGGPYVAVVDKPGAVQSVISIAQVEDVKPNNPDLFKIRVMNDVLGASDARLFNNLRERHGWTYGAYSNFNADKYAGRFGAGASTRTAVTDSAVAELLAELNRIGREAVADSELTTSKAYTSGNFIQSLERPQTVANFEINKARYNLPDDYYTNYLKSVAAVDKEGLKEVGGKYINPARSIIVVVGNAEAVADKLDKFGKVHYLNDHAVEVAANKLMAAPAGVTAQTVLADYIKAIGGTANIAKVKAISSTYKADLEAEGQKAQLTMDRYQAAGAKSLIVVTVQGQEASREVTNGPKSFSKGQMGPRQLTDGELKDRAAKANLFWEANPAQYGITPKLLGQEKVDGKVCNKVEFAYPSGETSTDFFDAATGLRIRRMETRKGPQGPVPNQTEYSDYRDAGEGVKIPGAMGLQMGPMALAFKLETVKVNDKLKEALFEVK